MDVSLWSSLGDVAGTAVRTAAVYLLMLVAVRVAGRRTVSQMSAFDAIVTVALGSLAASSALPSNPALSDVAAALLTFLGLQVLIGAMRQRFGLVERGSTSGRRRSGTTAGRTCAGVRGRRS